MKNNHSLHSFESLGVQATLINRFFLTKPVKLELFTNYVIALLNLNLVYSIGAEACAHNSVLQDVTLKSQKNG